MFPTSTFGSFLLVAHSNQAKCFFPPWWGTLWFCAFFGGPRDDPPIHWVRAEESQGLQLGAQGGPPAAARATAPWIESVRLLPRAILRWMDKIVHHFETTGNKWLLEFTGELSFQAFLGGAGFRPSTLNPPVVPVYPFLGEGSPTKIDYIKKEETQRAPLF